MPPTMQSVPSGSFSVIGGSYRNQAVRQVLASIKKEALLEHVEGTPNPELGESEKASQDTELSC